jgi:hypothetical protein
VAQLEEWLAARGGPAGFLNSDALFLLASANPKHQGLVRRVVYRTIDKINLDKPIDAPKGPKNWFLAWDGLLLGEYYYTTGDPNVLPYLEKICAWLAARQHPLGGYRHNYPGGDSYGLLPAIGLPATMAFKFADDAGLKIDQGAFRRSLQYFGARQASMGMIIYGVNVGRDSPIEFTHRRLLDGQLHTQNGAVGSAAVLYDWMEDTRTAHLCSLISSYAFNTTYGGHGGNFWNNFWTPLGSHVHGRELFIHFWQGHRWYREVNRLFDGSLITNESARVGAGHGVALTTPLRRLRITGAPASPFIKSAPDEIKPAVAAYTKRDYAKAQQLAEELLAGGQVTKAHRPTVEKLIYEAKMIQESIALDVAKLNSLIKEGRFHEAKMDITQLKGVMPKGDARLAAIEKALKGTARENDVNLYKQAMASLKNATDRRVQPDPETQLDWTCVVTEIKNNPRDRSAGKVDDELANKWRLKVVEDRSQAPEGWVKPNFNDRSWDQTTLPISWPLNHTALLRTTFEVKDLESIKGLRFRAWLFRQQDIAIYINGELVGRVNNLEKKTSNVEAKFNEGALKPLKQGTNTLAVVTRQNWRWGMLFMRVYNDGFGFRLDVGKKKAPAATPTTEKDV